MTSKPAAPTMRDVARRAGVSPKTVSNVLNGYRYLAPDTRDRVLAAIEELGYERNPWARGLKSGRTDMIGLVVPELALSYFADLAEAVMDAAKAVGWSVLIHVTRYDHDTEVALLQESSWRQAEGLLFWPSALTVEEITELPMPTVFLGERVGVSTADRVTTRNLAAGRVATEHLLSRGRSKIAVVGYIPDGQSSSGRLRLRGHYEALAAAGLEAEPTRMIRCESWHHLEGARAMERLLEGEVAFDAVMCMNDALAIGALRTLNAHRINVPGEVAVVGFDNTIEAQFATPPLTSVGLGLAQIAEEAVGLLRQRVEDLHLYPPRVDPPREVLTDFQLIVRETS